MNRWWKGEPSWLLEIAAPDITCFDSFTPRRIDGIEALSEYDESIRGASMALRH